MLPIESPPTLFALPLFCFGLFLLARYTAITTGYYKDPLLQLFQKYGDDENHFHILPRFLLGFGLLLFTFRGALFYRVNIPSEMELIGVIFLVCSYFYTRLPLTWRTKALTLPHMPLWYHRLRQETDRHERRRLAYMWLRLPKRTRLTLNINDHAFFLWVDLVTLATGVPSVHEYLGNQIETPPHVHTLIQTISR